MGTLAFAFSIGSSAPAMSARRNELVGEGDREPHRRACADFGAAASARTKPKLLINTIEVTTEIARSRRDTLSRHFSINRRLRHGLQPFSIIVRFG
jgi:hypothetical protein